MRFEDEIRDSVYMAKYFESDEASAKFNLKFNGQLCFGNEIYKKVRVFYFKTFTLVCK